MLQQARASRSSGWSSKPGAAPTHAQRSEYWIVISGEARVTRGDRVYAVRASESTCIPAGSPHRLENPGPGPLLVIEVQCGKYLGEDDIVDSDTRQSRRPEGQIATGGRTRG